MHQRILRLSLVALLLCSAGLASAQDRPDPVVPVPSDVFGFTPGDDGKLIDYSQLVDYLHRAAEASPRVEVREVGRTTLDRPMVLALISSPDNLARIDELREINRR
ncbi:MAG: peptidase M14, partial [Holophagae bacterium]